MAIDAIQKDLLEKIADLHEVPQGAYNIRANGSAAARNTTANIDIVTKTDKPGIDIIIKPGTKNESVHIPVVISQTGHTEMVYNDFYIGEGADVTIVAGCGIHNTGDSESRHDGIHTFYVGKNAKMRYVEKHYGAGDGNGIDVVQRHVCLRECFTGQSADRFRVTAGCDFRHHTAIDPVQLHLGGNAVAEDFSAIPDDGYGSLVAGGFNG